MLVCGTIMGALVSSQATIGTAQLAFSYGISAWWFTLGCGLGCVTLALGYAKRLRGSGCTTLMGVIAQEYGSQVEYVGSILSSIGMVISVLAQLVACMGLITVIFPISIPAAAIVSVVLMTVYVVFGGAFGAGMGGVLKLVLLYASCIVGLAVVLIHAGGLSGLLNSLKATTLELLPASLTGLTDAGELTARYGSLIARGAAKDLGSGLSLMLGVLSTQTYAQAIWSGRSDECARKGGLLAAFLAPPLGIAGIAIGLFMRGHYVTQAELEVLTASGQTLPEGIGILSSTIQVFPTFVVNHLPVFFAGIVLGTLLITVVGGGAGLSLGVATTLVKNIYKKLTRRFDSAGAELNATRATILAVLAVSAVIACIVPSATINNFGFLSMGLRGAVVFIPLTMALFFPGRMGHSFALLSTICGPLTVLLANFLHTSIDPLFIGMGVCILIAVAGSLTHREKEA